MIVNDGRDDDFTFCEEYLVKVSRTFAINIKILRGLSYRGILLAYLLCRIADTIEDDPFLPVDVKVVKLREYAKLFPPSHDYRTQVSDLLRDMTFKEHSHDADLLLNAHRVFNEFVKLPERLVSLIGVRVREMAHGMADFQEKKSDNEIMFLEDKHELDRYCYFVAGTVGLMITSVFAENSRMITPEIREKLWTRSVPFGLGLQITNIAKDFYGDHERGWCYVPRSFYVDEGIDPVRDTFRENANGYIAAHKRLITLALEYLDEALLYTLDIPRPLYRYRLFCLWPLFMAIESLAALSGDRHLFEGQIVKITRKDVTRILRNTSMAVMSNSMLKHMYYRTRRKITNG